MSFYPIAIEEISLNHKGGTKSYHLMLLANQDNKSVVVYRFGKTGVFGQVIVDSFEDIAPAEKVFKKKLREKQNNGYGPIAMPIRPGLIENSEELKSRLGRALLPIFGPSNLLHLDPDFDVTGIRSSRPEYDEDGQKIDPGRDASREMMQRAQKIERETKEAARKREEDEVRSQMAQLPTFGMF